jgi:hypothetical protein
VRPGMQAFLQMRFLVQAEHGPPLVMP